MHPPIIGSYLYYNSFCDTVTLGMLDVTTKFPMSSQYHHGLCGIFSQVSSSNRSSVEVGMFHLCKLQVYTVDHYATIYRHDDKS